MKKITILLLALLSFSLSKSFSSELKVYAFDNSLIKVLIDGRIISDYSRFVSLNNLTSGKHSLKILKLENSGMRLNSRPILAYSGRINIPNYSKVNVKLNRFRDIDIEINRYQNYYEKPSQFGFACGSRIQDFEYLLNDINRASFDRDKLIIAMQAVRENQIFSYQVLKIMEMLSFESNKLKFAKFAYDYTIDKNKYYIVNRGFSFSSSIKRLDNYIYTH